MNRKKLLTFLSVCLSALCASAQNKIINLWDGTPPDAIADSSYKEDTIYNSARQPRLVKVTTPTLTIFQPSEGSTNRHAAVVVCPGGGYHHLSYDDEGLNVGKALADSGFTAFVLKYRLPSDRIMKNRQFGPLADAQCAIRLIRQNAEKYDVDPRHIGIMGFSAGGHLAASTATLSRLDAYDAGTDTTSARPDFAVIGYGVLTLDKNLTHAGTRKALIGGRHDEDELAHLLSPLENIDADTPPAFLFHATDDPAVSPKLSIAFAEKLLADKTPAEAHIFTRGRHGFGLGKELRAAIWFPLFVSWFDETFTDK